MKDATEGMAAAGRRSIIAQKSVAIAMSIEGGFDDALDSSSASPSVNMTDDDGDDDDDGEEEDDNDDNDGGADEAGHTQNEAARSAVTNGTGDARAVAAAAVGGGVSDGDLEEVEDDDDDEADNADEDDEEDGAVDGAGFDLVKSAINSEEVSRFSLSEVRRHFLSATLPVAPAPVAA